MEPRFGVHFGHVRTHTDSDAVQMNRDVGAKAFTQGADIYYGAGSSTSDLELTAHELTHVVQQTGSVPLQPKRMDEVRQSNAASSVQRTCPACAGENKKNEESPLQALAVQRTIGDGHDFPPASRFSGNATLEGVFDNERVLQSGSSGAPVTLVQQVLINLGYPLPRFGADGDFGDETRRAVDAFQRDVGLGPDGRVGFRTIDFLDRRDRGVEVAPPARPVIANTPFNVANAIAVPGAAPSNALGPGVWGLTFPENVQVTIDVFNNAGVWQPVVTGVTGNYSLQTRLLPGVAEVTGPAGNTTAANYCAQINDLDSLTHAAAAWFMLSAVLAHERVHARQFRTALIDPLVIAPLEAAIEAITVPATILTPTAGVAEFFIRADPAFAAALNAAQANWLAQILVLVVNDHNPGGTADTEEHAIVDPMRRRICQHARANGWPACPPLCP
jgi:peptidoglycan hydrolase-like protein with peptidoglycan-binding domain